MLPLHAFVNGNETRTNMTACTVVVQAVVQAMGQVCGIWRFSTPTQRSVRDASTDFHET